MPTAQLRRAGGPVSIVVLVKYVPDDQAPRRLTWPGRTTDRDGVAGLLSGLDGYAVEEALRLFESNGGAVTAVTMGPSHAVERIADPPDPSRHPTG